MATLTTLPTWYVASNGLDITKWMIDFNIRMGRQHEIDRTESSTLSMTLDNRSGTFTPWNTNTYTFAASNSNFVGTASLGIEVLIATGTTVTYFWNSTSADPVTGAQQGGIFSNYAQMVGNSVTLSGFSTAGYNGTFTVTAATPASFTVSNTTTGTPATYGKVTSVTLSGSPLVMNSLIEVGGVYPTTGGTFSQLYSGYVNVVQPDAPDELNSQVTIAANDVLKTFAARLLSNSDIYPNFTTAAYDQSALTNATQLYVPVLAGDTKCYVYSNLSGITGTAVSLKIVDGARSETVTATWGTAVTLGSGRIYPVTITGGFTQSHGQGCFVGNYYSVDSANPAIYYRGNEVSGFTADDYFNYLNGSYGGRVSYETVGAHLYDASGAIGMNSTGWLTSNPGSLTSSSSWTNSFWLKTPSPGDVVTTVYDNTNQRIANLTVNPDYSVSVVTGTALSQAVTLLGGDLTSSSTTVITSRGWLPPGPTGTLSAINSTGGTVSLTYSSVVAGYYTPGFSAIPSYTFTVNVNSVTGVVPAGSAITYGSTPLNTEATTNPTNLGDGLWHHIVWQHGPAVANTINGSGMTGASTTLTLTSTANFAASGLVSVAGSGGTLVFSYTAKTGTTLTGCVLVLGTSGWTIATGASIAQATAVFVDGLIADYGTVVTTVFNDNVIWGGSIQNPQLNPTITASSSASIADMLFVNTAPLVGQMASNQYQIGSLLAVQEYVGQKIKDALIVAQFPGSTTNINNGYLLCVGDTSSVNQSNVLDYILNHVETEQGFFYQDTTGALTLLNRFYTQETPARQISGSVVKIGDSGSMSAFYEPGIDILQDDLDVWNRAQVTTYAGSAYETGNSQSVSLYGSRTLPKSSIYTVTSNDTTALAQMLLYRYATPQVRVQKVTLSTKANDNTPIQVALKLWDQITFYRHGSGNSTLQKQLVIEAIEQHFVADPGDLDTTIVLSPFELVTGSSTPDSGSVFRFSTSNSVNVYSHFATTGQDHFGG